MASAGRISIDNSSLEEVIIRVSASRHSRAILVGSVCFVGILIGQFGRTGFLNLSVALFASSALFISELVFFWPAIAIETLLVNTGGITVVRKFGCLHTKSVMKWEDVKGPVILTPGFRDVHGSVAFKDIYGFERRVGFGLAVGQEQELIDAIIKAKEDVELTSRRIQGSNRNSCSR